MNTSQNIELEWLTVAKHTASKREGHEQKVNNKNIEFKWLTVPKRAASTHEQKTNCKNFKKFRKVCLFSYLLIVSNYTVFKINKTVIFISCLLYTSRCV